MNEVPATMSHACASGNPFAPQHCPDCGYSLTGLPPAGVCPECGAPYDEGMILVYGYGAGPNRHWGNRRDDEPTWLRISVFGFAILVLVLFWLNARNGRVLAIIITFMVASSAIGWWRRRSITSPLPVQLRLQAEGFAQRDGFGVVKLRPWTTWGLRVRIRRAGTRSWIVQMTRPWLVPQIQPFVGIEFDAEIGAVVSLHRQLVRWLEAAGGRAKIRFTPDLGWWQ